MLTTTKNKILSQHPCNLGWCKLTGQSFTGFINWEGDDVPLAFPDIAKSNGVKDAFWALRCLDSLPREKVLGLANTMYELFLKLLDNSSIESKDIKRERAWHLNAWCRVTTEPNADRQINVTYMIHYYAHDMVYAMNRLIDSSECEKLDAMLLDILTKYVSEE